MFQHILLNVNCYTYFWFVLFWFQFGLIWFGFGFNFVWSVKCEVTL